LIGRRSVGCLGTSASFNSLSFRVNRAHVRKSGQIFNQGIVRSILSVDRQKRQDGVRGSGAERVESEAEGFSSE
jgi:hypothetical protein